MIPNGRTRITITIDEDLAEQIDFYCDNLNIRRSQFIELILQLNIMGIGISLSENDTATMEGIREIKESEITKDKEVMESLKGLMKVVSKSQRKDGKNEG